MRKIPVTSLLCRAVLAFYPKEFRHEFAAEILDSFSRHYQEERRAKGCWRILPAEFRDLLDLLRGAFAERLAFFAQKTREKERMKDGMGDYRVVFRLYFAWQAKEEADWLRAMSRAGWELVHANWCLYYFRRMEEPREYEYKLERRVGLRWLLDVQEAYPLPAKARGLGVF